MTPSISAIALSALLIPFSVSFADDQETQQRHNNFYQQSAETSCPRNEYYCLYFPATTRVTTAISNVSCGIVSGSGASVAEASISTQSNTKTATFFLQAFYAGYHTSTAHFGVNGTPNLFVTKGDKPAISVYVVSDAVNTTLACTISGYHS